MTVFGPLQKQFIDFTPYTVYWNILYPHFKDNQHLFPVYLEIHTVRGNTFSNVALDLEDSYLCFLNLLKRMRKEITRQFSIIYISDIDSKRVQLL